MQSDTQTEKARAPRVLLVGDHPPPHGGVAVHVETLLRAVRAAGGEGAVLDIGSGQVPADGVYPSGGYARFATQLASFAARGYLLHVHTGGDSPSSLLLAAACAVAGRASRKPPLLTLHSGVMAAWLESSAAWRAVASGVFRSFGTVVAVSEQIAKVVLQSGLPPERLLTLPAFSSAYLEPGELPLFAARARELADPMLCAMLAPRDLYGAVPLLEAFARVHAARPRAHLVVFGPGTRPAELRPLLEKHAGAAAAQVIGLGELGRPAALAVMASADLFVRPTLADGDSVSVREALALGRLVVCTSVGTRPAGVHLVPPGDAPALAAGILSALAQRDRAQSAPAAFRDSDCDLLRVLLPRYGLNLPALPNARAA